MNAHVCHETEITWLMGQWAGSDRHVLNLLSQWTLPVLLRNPSHPTWQTNRSHCHERNSVEIPSPGALCASRRHASRSLLSACLAAAIALWIATPVPDDRGHVHNEKIIVTRFISMSSQKILIFSKLEHRVVSPEAVEDHRGFHWQRSQRLSAARLRQ